MTDDWPTQAGRLRELARDPAVRAYLLGRLLAETPAAELADLVQACLVYRERFGASGNDRRQASVEPMDELMSFTNGVRQVIRREAGFTPEMPDL